MDKIAFAKRLKSIRIERNFTSDSLAAACSISSIFIRQMESAHRLPSISKFVLIINALKIYPSALLVDSLNKNEITKFNKLLKSIKRLDSSKLKTISSIIKSISINLNNFQNTSTYFNKLAFGNRIEMARKEQNLTADNLSRMCKMNPVFIRQIEKSARLPSLPSLVIICNKLKVTPDHLLIDSLSFDINEKYGSLYNEIYKFTPKQFMIIYSIIKAISNDT